MTIKRNQAIILSAVIFVAVILIGFRTLTPEDEWTCENGRWVAHGKPITPKPIVNCVNIRQEKEINLPEKYCQIDADCACGSHKSSGACFYGNRSFVNVQKQCPDFCSGIDGQAGIRCENNTCVQKKVDDGIENVIK